MDSLQINHYVHAIRLERESVESFEVYPFNLPACQNLKRVELHPAVTFFVGENGSGKSTLLEAIAVEAGFNAEGGTKNFGFATRESHSTLHEHLTLEKTTHRPRDGFFLRAESFFNVATEMENLDAIPAPFAPLIVDSYGGTSLHEQSHGESFFALAMNRFGGHGLYVLDEPEAALSPTRQLSLLARIHDLVKMNSQFIIATHSPLIMAYPNAVIYNLTENGIEKINYTDTEHYAITREFLNKPEVMLRELLNN